MRIFGELQEAGLEPCVVTFNALIRGYGNLRQLDKIREVWKQLLISR